MSRSGVENSLRREISRECVALLKERVGRGPTLARTYLGENLVLIVFEETLTRGERVLAAEGRLELVREMRRSLLATMESRFGEIVAARTGRSVRAVLGDHAVTPDLGALVLLLQPPSAEGGNGTDASAPALTAAALADRGAETRSAQRSIARGLTALYKDLIGRGPNEVHAHVEESVVAVVLTETMTKVERTLAEGTGNRAVREMRREFQDSLRDRAVEIVEAETGRAVIAFLSDHAIGTDEAIEVFVLGDPAAPPPADP